MKLSENVFGTLWVKRVIIFMKIFNLMFCWNLRRLSLTDKRSPETDLSQRSVVVRGSNIDDRLYGYPNLIFPNFLELPPTYSHAALHTVGNQASTCWVFCKQISSFCTFSYSLTSCCVFRLIFAFSLSSTTVWSLIFLLMHLSTINLPFTIEPRRFHKSFSRNKKKEKKIK